MRFPTFCSNTLPARVFSDPCLRHIRIENCTFSHMTLDFSGYFEATEQAFHEEKEDMLYKIARVQKEWHDNIELDELAKQRCVEMMGLKRILMKGHLQILRMHEEQLQMQMKNAALAFHVRQLQKELFRLLPHAQDNVPSIEYHMSLDRELYREKAPTLKIEEDEKYAADIAKLHRDWKALCELQAEVFQEELQKREKTRNNGNSSWGNSEDRTRIRTRRLIRSLPN